MKYLNLLLKHFGQILSVFSVITLVLGYLGLLTYYSNYGIEIWHYIGVSEVILLSLKFISDGMLFLGLQLVVITYTIVDIINCKKEGKSMFDWLKQKYVITIAIIVLILMIVTGLIPKYYPSFSWNTFINYMGAQVFLYLLGFAFIPVMFLKIELKFEEIFIRVILIFLGQIFFVMLFLPANESSLGTQRPQASKVKFVINDTLHINSPDSIKFIGNTSNYYFFYDDKNKRTTIYPARSISKIEYENIKFLYPSKE